MKIAIASDFAGQELKSEVINYLNTNGYEVKDFCPNGVERTADYPDFAVPTAVAVSTGECDYGILICGTGVGMSICANKVDGIRCALCSDCFSAEATRLHNNANMMALGARVIGVELALRMVNIFLTTEHIDVERHTRRINKITDIERM